MPYYRRRRGGGSGAGSEFIIWGFMGKRMHIIEEGETDQSSLFWA